MEIQLWRAGFTAETPRIIIVQDMLLLGVCSALRVRFENLENAPVVTPQVYNPFVRHAFNGTFSMITISTTNAHHRDGLIIFPLHTFPLIYLNGNPSDRRYPKTSHAVPPHLHWLSLVSAIDTLRFDNVAMLNRDCRL